MKHIDGPKFYMDKHREWLAKSYPGHCLYMARKTNRHTTTRGYNWGWYEIVPIGVTVGCWDEETPSDDIPADFRTKWNEEALSLLQPTAHHQTPCE